MCSCVLHLTRDYLTWLSYKSALIGQRISFHRSLWFLFWLFNRCWCCWEGSVLMNQSSGIISIMKLINQPLDSFLCQIISVLTELIIGVMRSLQLLVRLGKGSFRKKSVNSEPKIGVPLTPKKYIHSIFASFRRFTKKSVKFHIFFFSKWPLPLVAMSAC